MGTIINNGHNITKLCATVDAVQSAPSAHTCACAASGAKRMLGQTLSFAATCSFSSASSRVRDAGALILAHAHCRGGWGGT
jgi:hypothetical protein